MREDPTLTLAAFGAAVALLAYSLLMMSGYATVARRWLSEAWERHQSRRANYLLWLALRQQAALSPPCGGGQR